MITSALPPPAPSAPSANHAGGQNGFADARESDVDDLVRVTTYAAGWSPEMAGEFEAAIADVREEMPVPRPLSR